MAAEINLSGFSGFDTQGIADALAAAERANVDRLTARRAKGVARQNAWAGIATKMSALGTAAANLASQRALVSSTATSSKPEQVAISGGAAQPGSLDLRVARLATTALHAVSGFNSSVDVVGAGQVAVSRGLSSMGLASVTASASARQDITVTQASSAATLRTSPAPLTFGAGETLSLTLTTSAGAVTRDVALAGDVLSDTDLAAAVTSQLSGFGVEASVHAEGGITLSTTSHGSGVTLSASGAAAASLGLSASAQGSDAVVVVGTEETVLTEIARGATVTLASSAGPLTAVLSGSGLSAGQGWASSYSFGAGTTLADVARTLNGATSPVSAVVIGSGTDTQMLLSGRVSGADADADVSWSGFSAGNPATRLRSALDAQIEVGTMTLYRASNVVTDLLPGATVTLKAPTGIDEVTLTTTASADALVSAARAFVSAANEVLNTLDAATRANPSDPSRAGALVGDSAARGLRREVLSALTSTTGTGAYTSLSSVGLSLTRAGIVTLDEAALRTAALADPQSVQSLFARTVSAEGYASFVSAPPGASPGTYPVTVTQAAAPATLVSNVFGTLAQSERMTITLGDSSLVVTAPRGANAAALASLLNDRFAAASLPVHAAATEGTVALTSTSTGSSVSLAVTSTGSELGWGSVTSRGVDVAGTIDGAAATGSGNILTSAAGASTGLALLVSMSAQQLSILGGTAAFSARFGSGAAGVLRSAVDRALGTSGAVGNARASADSFVSRLDQEISRAERSADAAAARIRRQFAALEVAISRMRSAVPTFPTLESQ